MGHRPVERLPLLRSDALEPGIDPAVQFEAAGVAELPRLLSHAVGARSDQGVGDLLGDLGAAPMVREAGGPLERLLFATR